MSTLGFLCTGQITNLKIYAAEPKKEAVLRSPSTGDLVEMHDLNFDKRKLRDHWPYLAEGQGGIGVLLGEKEAMVTRILGQSTRRSFDTFDEMYFERRTFSGVVYLYKGVVTRLRYYVRQNQVESLKWKTARGLRQEMVENLTEEEAKKSIISFYNDFYKETGKSARYLVKQGSLLVYSEGIGFTWGEGKLRYIDIFEAWHLPR